MATIAKRLESETLERLSRDVEPTVDGRLPRASTQEFVAALTAELAGEMPGFLHPVNWMGRTIWLLERLAPRSGKWTQLIYGTATAALVPAFFASLAWWSQQRAYKQGPTEGLAASALLLKSTFSVRGLVDAAGRVKDALEDEDIETARRELRALVARPAAELTPGLIASAAVESLAENTTDSFVAPWLYYAIGGLPAAFFYRAVNTLDSRIGYRDPEHRYLGWAAAKLDDLLNFVPARLSALFIVAAALVYRQDAGAAVRTMLRDRRKTDSPNAGWTMAAMAGALRTRLEKPFAYRLGHRWWARPDPKQIDRARWMTYIVAAIAALLVYGLLSLRERAAR